MPAVNPLLAARRWLHLGLAAGIAVSIVGTALPATALPGTGSAADRADERAATAGRIDLRIEGRGYGHGRGMSQYGAQGAALKGRSARQILDFYYPGTKVARAGGQIRVLVSTPPAARGLVVRHQRGLTVRRVATGAKWQLPSLRGSNRWRLRWTSRSVTRLELRRDGRWRPSPRKRWRSIGGPAQFAGGGPVELIRKGNRSSYRGSLRTYGGRPASMRVVNRLGLNAYLFGVVPRESPSSWEPAALRAQAVAARTYAQYYRRQQRPGYDLCDTTLCQVYGGRDAEARSTNRAVRATKRGIRSYGGRPIIAQFSSSNGGQVVGSSLAYQRYKSDPWDDDVNPNRSWTTRLDGKRVARQWNLGRLRHVRVVRRDGHGAWGGRVTKLRLVGTDRSVRVTGDTFRTRLGLKSTYIRIREVS